MPRMSPFNSPYLLGFDDLEAMIEGLAKSGGDGYPPYNIEQLGDDRLRISLAVAGFTREMIEVTVDGNQLTIRGRQGDEKGKDRVFLHRGIATRAFQRSFVLADGLEVAEADMSHGLLHIDLFRPNPEGRKRTIQIG